MPPHSKLSRSKAIAGATSIAHLPVLDFLVPAQHQRSRTPQRSYSTTKERRWRQCDDTFESFFFSALTQASTCALHQRSFFSLRNQFDPRTHRHKALGDASKTRSYATTVQDESTKDAALGQKGANEILEDQRSRFGGGGKSASERRSQQAQSQVSHADTMKWLNSGHNEDRATSTVRSWFPSNFFSNAYEKVFAESSRLPPGFFGDVHALHSASASQTAASPRPARLDGEEVEKHQDGREAVTSVDTATHEHRCKPPSSRAHLEDQLKLLESIRELEEKLANAKKSLQTSMQHAHVESTRKAAHPGFRATKEEIALTKEDYMNLVDLYYYSHNSRFSPESTDLSPTPSFMDDYSFQLSAEFTAPEREFVNEDETYESPLRHVEQKLRKMKTREIAIMQVFVDLLLDEDSSTRALYEAYKAFPKPGVAYLPTGMIRLFLQRMSTPWTLSEKSMLRYLSLIDDMQYAKLPISTAEWSSAVYLAGRSFAKVTDAEVSAAFELWREMETVAGVQSSHVTFNILFDIAVRAGKFALGQTILMEMSKRNLRLNRLGRVSLIYYHGLRGDGDGIRKTYRDFVEAGEIVDTLVLNCVIAALMNAQEPEAAHQVYERMKSMNQRAREKIRRNETDSSFVRYPPPADNRIDNELASQSLGRILTRAPHLRRVLPEHHAALQDSMSLSPDFVTYRAMLTYHATKSGDLDRLAVLLHEMTNMYHLPLRSLVFQLLFKGFTLHGPVGGPDSPWSRKRLELCWNAFRRAVKDTQSHANDGMNGPPAQADPVLPSIREINAIPPNAPIPEFKPFLHNPPPRRLSGWHEFVLDLAAFPQERLRRIERFHGQMFDDENMKKPHEKRIPHTYASPFFQSTVYQAPEPNLDHEEGEYVLPNPTDMMVTQPYLRTQPNTPPDVHQDKLNTNSELSEHDGPHTIEPNFSPYSTSSHQTSYYDKHDHYQIPDECEQTLYEPDQPQQHSQDQDQNQDRDQFPTLINDNDPDNPIVLPTRPLICWLLRAYSRNYKSRARVEEVWGAVRKMWKPKDALERESVVRVLRRCLKDCDREEGR